MTAALKPFPERVVAWQREHGRHHLPWQGTTDAYRIWLSEVMLQQTQVATVLSYYARFLDRYPDVAALAAAPLDDVLSQWSGLGYYSRARNLHRCAQAVVQEHGGNFPAQAAVLETLPGIGRSTAAAIAAFSAGERAAILDGNVKRVLARHLAFGEDLSRPAALRSLWAEAEVRLPAQAGEPMRRYTQGLMDLGATLCLARRPACDACPVQADCAAHRLGQPEAFPVKVRKRTRANRRNGLLLLTGLDSGGVAHVWLCRRPAIGVWASLWSLPEADNAQAWVERSRYWPGEGDAMPPFNHALTHFDWTLEPWWHRWPEPVSAVASATLSAAASAAVAAAKGRGSDPAESGAPLKELVGEWVPIPEALSRGLPTPVRRLLEGLSGML